MDDIKVIKCLSPAYNKSLIFSRLGYDKNHTVISGEAMHEVERLIFDAENTLNITATYRIMNILRINSPQVILEDGTILLGQKLSDLLKNSRQTIIMGATGGNRIMELIETLQSEGNMSDAVIIDAAASEITDSALDMVMAMVGQQLRSQGKYLTKMRFSPGYGDFDITQQKDFYRLLNGESLGLTLNEACMLIPEKSVFAIAGILNVQN